MLHVYIYIFVWSYRSTCSKHTILHRKRKFAVFVATLLNCFWPWPYVFTDLWENGVLGCCNAPRNFRWTPKAILLYRLLKRTVIFILFLHFCLSEDEQYYLLESKDWLFRSCCFVSLYFFLLLLLLLFLFYFLLFSTPVKTNSPMLSCIGVMSSIIHLK